jgi:hypothetical protein
VMWDFFFLFKMWSHKLFAQADFES